QEGHCLIHAPKCANPGQSGMAFQASTAPTIMEEIAGKVKLRFRLPRDVFRQASRGPTPVRKRRTRPIGTMILLKKGAPTVILYPRTSSESSGNSVPEIMAKVAPSSSRLLNMKLDSRETSDSSLFSARR